MTQGHYHLHHRRTLSGSNVPKVRTARPTLHRKGTSFVNHSIAKLGSGNPRRCESEDDRQYEMAASFLNFWYVFFHLPAPRESILLPNFLPLQINHSAYLQVIEANQILQCHVREADYSTR